MKKIMIESENYEMGTVINNKVIGEQATEALKAAEEETVRLEGMLSRFIPDSEISRINSSAGIRFEKVSCETNEVLSRAVEFSKCSQGCFDVTIGPLKRGLTSSNPSLEPMQFLLKGTCWSMQHEVLQITLKRLKI